MKITVIHGQNHKGSTYHVAKQVIDQFPGQNEVQEFFMPLYMPNACVGCFSCILKGEEKCPHNEMMKPIIEAIKNSQVIIIASPTYCLEMTGGLKTFFDHLAAWWLPHRPQEFMMNKIGIAISTTAGAGAKGVTKSIKRQLFWLGISHCKQIPVTVGAMKWADVSEKKKEEITKQISKTIKNLNQPKKPTLKYRFLFRIMKMSQKANTWNPTDKNHWEKRGWLNNKKPWN